MNKLEVHVVPGSREQRDIDEDINDPLSLAYLVLIDYLAVDRDPFSGKFMRWCPNAPEEDRPPFHVFMNWWLMDRENKRSWIIKQMKENANGDKTEIDSV
jgi:hypothetical protein